jgi:hypothetical protein
VLVLWSAGLAGCGGVPGGDGTQTVVTPVVEGLNNPTGLLVSTDGSLTVAESGAGRIIRVDTEGAVTTLVDGFDLGTYTPYDIGPLSLALAGDGSLIVGEGGNRAGRERVSFFGSDGTATHEALTPVRGSDFFGIALEPSTGALFIAGTGSNRIYRAAPATAGGFDPATDFVTDTLAEPLSAAAPSALAFDGEGRLLVGFADADGGKISVLTTAAEAESPYVEDLVAATGSVMAITIRPSDGAIVYVEQGAGGIGTIHVIDPEGVESTLASGLAGPTDLAYPPSTTEDKLYVTLLGDTPNAEAGSVVTVEIVEITTNGTAEEEPQEQ